MAEPESPFATSDGRGPHAAVPWRTILACVAVAGAAYLGFRLIVSLERILTWIIIAGFFAVVLNPAVDILNSKGKLRRPIAALVVFVVSLAVIAGLLYLFIRPIVTQANKFADNFPHYVDDAKAGKGPVGKLVKRYKIDKWVNDNQSALKNALQHSGKHALPILKKIGNTVAAIATILVLTYLLLVEGPRIMAGGVGMLSPPTQSRLKAIGRDASKAITGYMFGNVLISVIAAIVTYCGLWAFGVPFRTVMAVWVGFADLVPLVGATLGAVPTVLVALLHSPTAAIGMIILYVVYQQFENHVLQVGIMARTVKLSPLTVLVALITGVQLAGLLGALLAIPFAAVIQVIIKDVYQDRQRTRGERLAPPAPGNGRANATDHVATDDVATDHVGADRDPANGDPGNGDPAKRDPAIAKDQP